MSMMKVYLSLRKQYNLVNKIKCSNNFKMSKADPAILNYHNKNGLKELWPKIKNLKKDIVERSWKGYKHDNILTLRIEFKRKL